MQVSHAAEALDYNQVAGNIRTGTRPSRILLTGREGAPDNYRFSLTEKGGAESRTTPRHHHNFEQIRYVIDGEWSLAKGRVLPAGWVAYFPESAFYGPQLQTPELTMVTLQFGGPSGLGFWSPKQRREALDALLAAGGEFRDGIYTWQDESGKRHNKDAAEACWEYVFGRKVVYPPRRYGDIIVMNPESFSWIADGELPGIWRKDLGCFSERATKIGFIRMSVGAELTFGIENAAEIAFVTDGSIGYEGTEHGRFSSFGTGAEEDPTVLRAAEESTLFYVKLPSFPES
jgi:hypothetical protein